MSVFVISDTHVRDAGDPLLASLVQLIQTRPVRGDTLVLAGDVFDLFIGNKAVFLERYAELISALQAAGSRGVKIHYIEGNHDFQVKGAFATVPGMKVHSSEVELEIDGKKFYISHGDLVDPSDIGYRVLRGFLRSPFMRSFIRTAPGSWIDWIGTTGSRKSREAKDSKKAASPKEFPIDRMEKLRKAYRSFAAERIAEGFDFVIMGHCHDLDEMCFSVDGRPGQYMNVGYPRVHGSYLSWEPGEVKIGREKLPTPQSSRLNEPARSTQPHSPGFSS